MLAALLRQRLLRRMLLRPRQCTPERHLSCSHSLPPVSRCLPRRQPQPRHRRCSCTSTPARQSQIRRVRCCTSTAPRSRCRGRTSRRHRRRRSSSHPRRGRSMKHRFSAFLLLLCVTGTRRSHWLWRLRRWRCHPAAAAAVAIEPFFRFPLESQSQLLLLLPWMARRSVGWEVVLVAAVPRRRCRQIRHDHQQQRLHSSQRRAHARTRRVKASRPS